MAGRDVICSNLSKTFGIPTDAVAAVDEINITFATGQTTALVGPSGCGKSTLLRMIAGLEDPSTGSVLIGDETPLAVAKRGGLSMAFQDPSLLPWKTVAGNVALGLKLAGKPADAQAVQDLITLVGLAGFENTRPAALSGGMRQRAAIARCLISAPDLVLLDEPFGAVDALTRNRLNAELPPLWRDAGKTAVFVTHSVKEAVMLSDRIVVLSARPATIVADIAVDLTGVRDASSAAFHEVSKSVTDALLG